MFILLYLCYYSLRSGTHTYTTVLRKFSYSEQLYVDGKVKIIVIIREKSQIKLWKLSYIYYEKLLCNNCLRW